MRDQSVPESLPSDRCTTGDVARALHMSREGVRYLVRDRQLACTRSPSKLRLFQNDEVRRLADLRTRARLAGKLPARPKLGPRGEPRQMSLPGTQLRLIAATPPAIDKGQVRQARLFGNQAVSDNGANGNQRAAGSRR